MIERHPRRNRQPSPATKPALGQYGFPFFARHRRRQRGDVPGSLFCLTCGEASIEWAGLQSLNAGMTSLANSRIDALIVSWGIPPKLNVAVMRLKL